MTGRAVAIATLMSAAFEELRELERDEPEEVEAIVCSVIAHLRAWKPVSVAPLAAGFSRKPSA